MGVNLRLEGVELALSLGFMLRHNIVHKPPYLPGHVLYGIAQMLYLVGTSAPDLCLQIACLNFIDGFLQLLDGVRYPGGDIGIDDGHDKKDKGNHENYQKLCLDIVEGHAVKRRHPHHLPACVSHGLNRDGPFLPVHGLTVIAVPESGYLQVVLPDDSRVNKLGLGVVYDFPAAAD